MQCYKINAVCAQSRRVGAQNGVEAGPRIFLGASAYCQAGVFTGLQTATRRLLRDMNFLFFVYMTEKINQPAHKGDSCQSQ